MHTTEQLNTALAGRYEIERRAGEGGMATVYVARDIRHNRKVALKVLKPELGVVLGPERFLTEIQVTANLHHPNLLPLFDSGETGGILYYVMPVVEGETLRQRLERERQFPVDEAVRITAAIASALDYAHRHNVIHRDLKPENVLMHEGQPLVMDFGIALAVSNAGGARITQTGLSLGTPAYMSPEQATGDRQLDARTDIYSLAAICYEMLVGDPPHTGSTVQAVIAKVLTDHPRGIRASRPAVPEHVEAAVLRGLEKLPADRFATAAHFTEALTGARPVTTSAPSSPSLAAASGAATGAPRSRARELAAWAIAALAVGAAVLPRLTPAPELDAPVPVRFEVLLPESVSVSAGGGTKLALSRDGTQMLVVAQKPGEVRAVYMRRLGDPVAERVRGTDSATSPAFSPDGEWIIFGTGAIKKVPVAGGAPKELADSGGASSWGDGGRVLYSRGGAIWLTSSEGGERRRLVGPDTARRITSVVWPHVLPGGEFALVTYRMRGGAALDSSKLGVVSLETGELSELGIQGTNARYAEPGFIVFGRPGGEVYAAPFSLRRRAVTGPARLLLQDVWQGPGGATGFAVAQNGTLAYHASRTVSRQGAMFAVTRDGREQQLTRDVAYYKEPRVSPDGRRIAVRIDAGATTGDLWVYDVATGSTTRLTTDTSSIRGEWTRDGSRIAYVRYRSGSLRIQSRPWDRMAEPQVHALSAGPGAQAQLQEVSLGPARGWSAIRAGGSTANPDIFIAPTDSLAAMRPLVATAADETSPRVSPLNGRLLAYTSTEAGRREVYLVGIPDPGPRVPVSIDGGDEAIWSTDGATLYYRGPTHMMAASISEQPILRVTRRDTLFRDVYERYLWHAAYDVFPDGRFLMTRPLVDGTEPITAVFAVINWPQLIGTATGGEGR
jgi:serine/threonine-protein kinase